MSSDVTTRVQPTARGSPDAGDAFLVRWRSYRPADRSGRPCQSNTSSVRPTENASSLARRDVLVTAAGAVDRERIAALLDRLDPTSGACCAVGCVHHVPSVAVGLAGSA